MKEREHHLADSCLGVSLFFILKFFYYSDNKYLYVRPNRSEENKDCSWYKLTVM